MSPAVNLQIIQIHINYEKARDILVTPSVTALVFYWEITTQFRSYRDDNEHLKEISKSSNFIKKKQVGEKGQTIIKEKKQSFFARFLALPHRRRKINETHKHLQRQDV